MSKPRESGLAFAVGTAALTALAFSANCGHPTPGTGTSNAPAAGGSGSLPTGPGASSGASATAASGNGSGGGNANGGSGGAGSVMTLGGTGGAMMTETRSSMACAADPNQRAALAHAIGSQFTPADDTAATTLVQPMDLATKAKQLYGPQTSGYSDIFRTADEGSIKGFEFRDGPRGVNLDPVKGGGKAYATAFPSPSSRGSAWNVELEYRIGQAMGDELIASGGTMLLAPTINILRHPAWGRSQETYGEDSFQLGRLGTAFTVGAQEFAPACAKHFAANNVEKDRENMIAKMDEQTLHEVYSRHFGMVVEDGGVACIMAAYNQIQTDGAAKKCTQNKHLLTDILRTVFGFQGMVLSDWWAMPGSQAAPQSQWASTAQEAIQAGMDMELPWKLNFQALPAISGIEPTVTTAAQRVVRTKVHWKIDKSNGAIGLKAPTTHFDAGSYSITGNEAHLALAEQAAIEGSVLLKNEGNVLPIASTVTTVAVVGPQVPWTNKGAGGSGVVSFATDARMGDLGSSRVIADPAKQVGPCKGLQNQAPVGVNVVCGDGPVGMQAAAGADFVVVVAGLTPHDEGEDYTIQPDDSDRGADLRLDGKAGGSAQNQYINDIAAANPGKPVVVVLEGGSAIDVSPFIDNVKGLVMAWYPGIVGGNALGKLLFGADKASGRQVSFSGKLGQSWPVSTADLYPFSSPGTTAMDYYLGYRWYDTQNKQPRYPFGFGLSYSTFEYSNLFVPCTTVPPTGVVNVTVDVKNTGAFDADEVVFLFASYPGSNVPRRAAANYKELKGFQRASIPKGGAVRVTIPLRVSDLWYYDAAAGRTVEQGTVNVLVGGSSNALTQMASFQVVAP